MTKTRLPPHPFSIVFAELMRHINGAVHAAGTGAAGGDGCRDSRCRMDGAVTDEAPAISVDPLPGRPARRRGAWEFKASELPYVDEPGYQKNGRRKDGRRGRRIAGR